MPRNKSSLSQLGVVAEHEQGFRAHIQFRTDAEEKQNIYGPTRDTENGAQKDLDQIRAAGAIGTTREEGLKIMVAEARRIQIYADYQAQIKQTVQRMASKDVADESDYEDDDDISDHSEPPYLKDYPDEDSPKDEMSQPTPLTPLEATAKLSCFRPVISRPSDLKHLLESRADPNMPIAVGKISPLQNIMSFASMKDVVQMRDLLLKFGAKEHEEDKSRWDLRQRADAAEKIRLNNERSIVNERDYYSWVDVEGDW